MAAARKMELRDGQRGDSAQVADRKVDLTEQEDEDHAEDENGEPRHLHDDVVEVVGGEVVRRLEAEEDDDERDPDDDRQDAEVPGAHVVVRPAPEPWRGTRLVAFGETDPRCGDVEVRAHDASSGAASGIPATLVGIPAVIACAITCWVVLSRS